MHAGAPDLGQRYEIEATLGEGGVARVHRARDKATGRVVALKRLLVTEERHQRRLVALFEREYRTLAQLAHPSVVEVYDYDVDDEGRPFYTMELLEGADLRRQGPMPYQQACALLGGVASALSLLHSRRLVHRDVTSRNVIALPGDRAKLIDFGALLPMGPCEDIVGTPMFIAPEAVLTQPLDGRADLFSLGVVLYHALTGHYPFRAQRMSDLRQAWQRKPTPPSRLVTEIPAELERLVLSMISLDPAFRPRDAAEVMDRLLSIGGHARTESARTAQAYVSTPALVGRATEITRARELIVRTMRESSGGLLITGPSGVGRSRLLDACVLEAKVLGAAVVRAGSASAQHGPFSVAEALVEQLEQGLPGVVGAGSVRLESGRQEVIAGLRKLFLAALTKRSLVIAVDDVYRLDEPSVAFLSLLLSEAAGRRLLVVATVPSDVDAPEPAAFRHLLAQCEELALGPMTPEETRELLRSVFGAVPNIEVVSGRVHDLSQGIPRDAVTLAEHLIATNVVRYHAGAWILPLDLPASALPARMTDALVARFAAISPLGRFLAEAHALSAQPSTTLAEFIRLAGTAEQRAAHVALDELVAAGVFVTDGLAYTLKHRGWLAALTGGLTEEDRRSRHSALARMHEQGEAEPLAIAYHLLLAGEEGRALDVLGRFVASYARDVGDVFGATHLGSTELGEMFGMARDAFRRNGGDRKLYSRIRHFSMAMGVFVDAAWFLEAAPEVLDRLKRESGYLVWQALPPSMDPMARVMTALGQAQAAYDAAPPAERILTPGEAIRNMVQFAVAGVAVGSRTQNVALHRSLPELLVPFAPLSPVADAILQNTRALVDISYGRNESSRERFLSVLEKLAGMDVSALEHMEEIKDALTYGVCVAEMRMGLSSAARWMGRLDANPRHRGNALAVRAILSLQQGDWSKARAFKRQAEQFDMESDTKQIFGQTNLKHEVDAYALGLDLGAVKRLAGVLEKQAAQYPGWMPTYHSAQGEYDRLRGDFAAALEQFEKCIRLSEPSSFEECPDVAWYSAAAGKAETLILLEQVEEAKAWAERALRFSGGRPEGSRYHGVRRALALAEARLGDFDGARQRLLDVVGERTLLGTTGVHLGIVYEALALVEIWAGDREAFERYLTLTSGEYIKSEPSGFSARMKRLLEVAEGARLGRRDSILPTEGVPDPRPEPPTSLVARVMRRAVAAKDRAERGLALLCEQGNAEVGYLYLLGESGLVLAASQGAPEPDSELEAALQGCFQDEASGLDLDTVVVPDTEATIVGRTASFTSSGGDVYQAVVIRAAFGGEASPIGVAALRLGGSAAPAIVLSQIASALGDYFLQVGTVSGTVHEAK